MNHKTEKSNCCANENTTKHSDNTYFLSDKYKRWRKNKQSFKSFKAKPCKTVPATCQLSKQLNYPSTLHTL